MVAGQSRTRPSDAGGEGVAGSNPVSPTRLSVSTSRDRDNESAPGPLVAGAPHISEGPGVDNESVADVGRQHALVRLVDLVGGNHFDVGADVVLGAEVEHFLGLRDAADHGAGEGASG